MTTFRDLLTDTGENVQTWTRVFSTRRWVILVARTRRKKREKIACPLLDVFACGQVSSPRLYRLTKDFFRNEQINFVKTDPFFVTYLAISRKKIKPCPETEKFCRKRNSGHLGHPRKVLRRKKRFQWGMSLKHQIKESCPTPCQKRNYLIKAQVK